MRNETIERYERTEPEIYRQNQNAVATAAGNLALFLIFDGLMGGVGTHVGVFGDPAGFAHTTTAIAEVNNIAPPQPVGERRAV